MILSNTITNYNSIKKLSQTLSFCIPTDTKIQTLPMENQLQEMLHYTMDRLRVAGKHTPIIKPYLNTHIFCIIKIQIYFLKQLYGKPKS